MEPFLSVFKAACSFNYPKGLDLVKKKSFRIILDCGAPPDEKGRKLRQWSRLHRLGGS